MITQVLIKSGEYYDSVTLLEVAQGLLKLDGVQDAAVVMGTPANKGILKDAALLTPEVEGASADDLIIAVRVPDETRAAAAMETAAALLKASRAPKVETGMAPSPKTMATAIERLDGANIVLVSVAGRYAPGVVRDALERGLHVFLFSDNVSIEDEIALKKLGREKGLLVMGPDAGTAILNGVALGFANAVIPGPVGVVAASGTGLQAVTSTLTQLGVGISQAIGTGGRDLSSEVGGIMMIEGIRALQADPATEVLLLVSKPPALEVVDKVLTQLDADARSENGGKPAVVCFLGGKAKPVRKAGLQPAKTLEEAAHIAAALARGTSPEVALIALQDSYQDLKRLAKKLKKRLHKKQKYLRGLFSGGTFCYEMQLILEDVFSKPVLSNAPIKKEYALEDANKSKGHTVVDLGEDEFTVGRLHPMLDPTLRNRRLVQEALDDKTAVIYLDVVLGYGVHPDPAGAAVEAIKEAQQLLAEEKGREVIFVASVCGTPDDPQDVRAQEKKLEEAGVVVMPTNASAARLISYILS
ncbi:MAG: acyl-CoA synthetase FdrA [Anaerolineae bacterium]|nr:acyl-CoA synthetase FdrA [Anaerolineae bacterium]